MKSEACEGSDSLARCSHIISHALVVEHVSQVPRLLLAASLPALLLHAPLTAASLLLLLLPKHSLPFLLLAAAPDRRSSRLELIGPICSTP